MIKHNGKKVSPKQWVLNKLAGDLDIITIGCDERYDYEYADMTEREWQECAAQFDLLHNRLMKVITSALKRDK